MNLASGTSLLSRSMSMKATIREAKIVCVGIYRANGAFLYCFKHAGLCHGETSVPDWTRILQDLSHCSCVEVKQSSGSL